jgi:hypothetical protein
MLHRHRRIILSISIALVTGLAWTDASAQLSYRMLDIPGLHQQQSNWCWVAVAQMIIRHLRPEHANVAQGDVLFATTHEYKNRTQSGADPLGTFGLKQTVTMAPISFQDIKNEINANRPVQADITWKSPRSGNHVTLIIGYIELNGTQRLIVWEPIDGWLNDTNGNFTYSAFKNNPSFKWHMTRYQIMP